MIFVTVGSHMPFNRLVRAIDTWCSVAPGFDVFGQLGNIDRSDYRPQNFEWTEVLSPHDFRYYFEKSSVVTSHAGMGTIIDAMAQSKPLLVMPRRAPQETRNNHQFATVKFLAQKFGIPVAYEEPEIPIRLESLLGSEEVDAASHQLGQFAEPQLLDFVRLQIELAGKDQSRLLV